VIASSVNVDTKTCLDDSCLNYLYQGTTAWQKEVCKIVYYGGTKQQLGVKLDKKILWVAKNVGPKSAQHVGHTSQVLLYLW